jgi:integrase
MAGNTQDKRVNDQRLRGLVDGKTLTESMAGRGTGSIFFKRSGTVITAYFRWNLNKQPGSIKIGSYKSTAASSGLSLPQIREKARTYSDILVTHGDPKNHLDKLANEAQSRHEAEAKAAAANANLGSFKDLLLQYAADLAARGRVKAKEVSRNFEMHVIEPFPALAAKPARDITEEDINNILDGVRSSKPRNRGIGGKAKAPQTSMASTENTIHTYLKAALQFGTNSRFSRNRKSQPSERKNFGLTVNVAAAVEKMDDVYEGTTESLEQHELMELLRYLDGLPARHRSIALAPIYLGGQRLKMILALKWEHMSEDGILIFDRKGKRGSSPHPHFLPLTPRIIKIMEPLLSDRLSEIGPFALSENLMRSDSAGKIYGTAGSELHSQGRTREFSWQNVRVACESVLAGIGINEETRAHILSHGRKSGIQSKHYDRNLYYKEKLEALTAWGAYLDDLRNGKVREDIRLANLSEMRGRAPG